MRIFYFLFYLCLCAVYFCSAYAGSMGENPSTTQLVASFSLGPGWYKISQNESLLLQSDFTNNYVANQNNRCLITGELFLGASNKLTPLISGQLGFAYALASHAYISGVIWETGDT